MTEFGYWLSSEEHRPLDLVRDAAQAEASGFTFAMISDHFHPWIDAQGQSPFVWSVLGGIAEATERIELATGVTCPLIRTHPAVVAQAAATVGAMLPGRFTLGVGTGENLNEHVTGGPLARTRRSSRRRRQGRKELERRDLVLVARLVHLLHPGHTPTLRKSPV